MGRLRLSNDARQPLPRGLQKHGRKFRARLPGFAWVYFDADYLKALAEFAAWRDKDPTPEVRSVKWLMDHMTTEVWPGRVRAGTLAERTLKDYKKDAVAVSAGLGHIPLSGLTAQHVGKFKADGEKTAPGHINKELACLSGALTWACAEAGYVPTNVAQEVKRDKKAVRDRLITDAEYLKVYNLASAPVKLAMTLGVRTLGSPADVLKYGPTNIRRQPDGSRTLEFKRGKTGVHVAIAIVGELASVLQPFIDNPTIHPTFIRTVTNKRGAIGRPYTPDGISSMFRRYVESAGVADFGLRDLRAKGATEMYRADPNNIRQIQLLLGHKSVMTTQIYLKGLVAEIVKPNERPILAAVA